MLKFLPFGSAILFSASLFAANSALATSESSPGYFDIASVEHVDGPIRLLGLHDLPGGIGTGLCNSSEPSANYPEIMLSPFSLSPFALSLSDIIDIGMSLGRAAWDFVKDNQPTLDLRVDVATATPRGLKCWTELSGFGAPLVQERQLLVKNFLGMKAVVLDYKVIWLPNGSFKGAGKYVGYATILPTNVKSILGWHLWAKTSPMAVYNAGSETQPVGAIHLVMNYRIESRFSKREETRSFYVDGLGNFKDL